MTFLGARQWVWTWIRISPHFGFVRTRYGRRVWCYWKDSVFVSNLSSMATPDIWMSFLPLPAKRRPWSNAISNIRAFHLQELFLAYVFQAMVCSHKHPSSWQFRVYDTKHKAARSGQLLYSSLAPLALFRPTMHIQTYHCLCIYNNIRLSWTILERCSWLSLHTPG